MPPSGKRSRRLVSEEGRVEEKEAVRTIPRRGQRSPGMQPVNTYLAVANVNASIGVSQRGPRLLEGVVLLGAGGQPRYARCVTATPR
jgi:hypothetical protein